MRGTPQGGIIKQKAALAAAPDAMKRPAAPCQKASHQSVTMIIARFMGVSLGYARIQVNT